ncbi:putative ubiquitin-conjugating enzyme E2 23 [Castilleja foliolosa]|uniref:Ubiquitin-conjugating enzyme E2 23 n=1 Tax=Castilleja foliolosa TaxID=1961234 RepID=A0ABD3D7V5_9LAMI
MPSISPSKFAFYASCSSNDLRHLSYAFPAEEKYIQQFIDVIQPLEDQKNVMFEIMSHLAGFLDPEIMEMIIEIKDITFPTDEEESRMKEQWDLVDPETKIGEYKVLFQNLKAKNAFPDPNDFRLDLFSWRMECNIITLAKFLSVPHSTVETCTPFGEVKKLYHTHCEKLKPSSVMDELYKSAEKDFAVPVKHDKAIIPEELNDLKFRLVCPDNVNIEIEANVAWEIGYIAEMVESFYGGSADRMEVIELQLHPDDVNTVVDFCQRKIEGLEPLHNLVPEKVFRLHQIAEFLKMDSLLEWTAYLISQLIRGKNPKEIRAVVDLDGVMVTQAAHLRMDNVKNAENLLPKLELLKFCDQNWMSWKNPIVPHHPILGTKPQKLWFQEHGTDNADGRIPLNEIFYLGRKQSDEDDLRGDELATDIYTDGGSSSQKFNDREGQISNPVTNCKEDQQSASLEVAETLSNFQLLQSVVPIDHYFLGKHGKIDAARKFLKKVQQDWDILQKNLPGGICVRGYEDRIDLLRAVIVGADGTPYQDGLFFFDFLLPPEYPDDPPLAYYHSEGWQINPNLDEEGKVRLSLLNTCTGEGDEAWVPSSSTILQVLVSLQGLVLNSKPYFTEAGYDKQLGTAEGEKKSLSYNENTFLLNCETMMCQMRKPPKLTLRILLSSITESAGIIF